MTSRPMLRHARLVMAALAAAAAALLAAVPAGAAAPTPRRPGPLARPAIVGGTPTSITAVPWQVFVRADVGGGYEYDCGGSILNATTIVTAAHCVFNERTGARFAPADLTVVAGVSNLARPEGTRQVAGVAAGGIRVHPGYAYTAANAGVAPDDVATLTLARALDLSGPAARPIGLAGAGAYPAAGTAALISGYGLQSTSRNPDGLLYRLDTTVGDPLSCGADANAVLLCVRSQVGSACQGDSGGPLAIGGALAGVASFVSVNEAAGRCGVATMNGYTNLAAPEIRDFVLGNDAPPRAPRGGRDVSARGVFRDGGSMTCSPGTWSDATSFAYTFVDAASGQALQSGASATYGFTAGDVGRTVACHVAASGPGGTGLTRTQASPQVGAAPAPVARPALRFWLGSAARVPAGRRFLAAVRVQNRGNAAARSVRVCLAPGRGLGVARRPRGTRRARGGGVCWSLGTLAAGRRRTVRVQLRTGRAPARRSFAVTLSSANGGGGRATRRLRVVRAR